MSATRRSTRAAARPLALLASLALLGAGLVPPALADEPEDDFIVTQEGGESDGGGAPVEDGATEGDDEAAEEEATQDATEEEATQDDGAEEGSAVEDSAVEDSAVEDGATEDLTEVDDPVLTPLVAEVEGVALNEIHYAGGNTDDFIEIAAPSGTDVSGWVVGSITRGDSPSSAAHVVTLPEGTTVPGNGVLAVEVPITNSTDGGYGSSPFVTTAFGEDGEIVGFWTIGEREGGVGSTAGTSALLPEVIRGQTATATGVLGSATMSLQQVDGVWVAAPPTRGEPNDEEGDPEPPESLTIAEVWGVSLGTLVTTTGVVTAHYPTGGFNGYVIQTPGTGGDTDLGERTVSDALFVFSPTTVGLVEPGQVLEVTGARAEFNGLHQITVNTTIEGQGIQILAGDFDDVIPVPDFVLPDSEEGRLAFQNMLVHPADRYVVSETFQLGGFGGTRFGSIGLGLDAPLVQESELANPSTDPSGYAAQVAANAARAVTLDDGQSAATPLTSEVPYLTGEPNVRTGVGLTFHEPVIVDYRFQWNFQPTRPINGNADDLVTFSGGDTQEANLTPPDVDGDVTLAIFNVLNYFTTLGVDQPDCWPFDPPAVPATVSGCNDPDPGPRGAWDQPSFERQQAKIVSAINQLDADVVALSEIENSAHFGDDRDGSLAILVEALNADAGSEVWAFAPSPSQTPSLTDDDVIRNAFIYQVGAVELAGEGQILLSESDGAFYNAREPLAQAFAVPGTGYEFLAVVNHLKSKSCSGYSGTDQGQGCWNGDRVSQAEALVAFAQDVAADAGIDDVFLVGDFNSYSAEDPLVVLEGDGYTNVNPAWDPATGAYDGSNTYVFSGRVGSLDHIFASESAIGKVTGSAVWSINANESVLAEYSRVGFFASEHFQPGTPFRASDHDPVIIGIDVPEPEPVDLTVLSINDLHGRIGSTRDIVGEPALAAAMACVVEDYRNANPNTLFVTAGDNIGATTFTSFIAQDFPTLDVLNALGVDVSALGNHEFDQGQDDLNDRVIPYSDFPWIAANIFTADGEHAYLPYVILESGGLNVAFIGGITEETPGAVTPSGVEGLEFTPFAEEINAYAEQLTVSGEADVVIAVVHEGFPTTSLDGAENTDLGALVFDAHPSISAVISGHTHLAYIHDVDGLWVTQAGQYGSFVGALELTIDANTGRVLESSAQNVPVAWDGPQDCELGVEVAAIVNDARIVADELGSEIIGEATDPFNRSQNTNGSENRGGESTLGALVADAQLWYAQQRDPGVQIAFTNSGGLRADLAAGDITVRDAGNIQPFANTLVTIEVTGAQLAQVLEEQWRGDEFAKLAQSSDFRYIYDPTAEPGERITAMFLGGEPIEPAQTYIVVVNSHMAAGGSDMETLAGIDAQVDTGLSDLEAMVEYIRELWTITPDYSQRAVGVTWISDPDAVYAPGDEVAVDVSSFVFTAGEPVPETLSTSLGGVNTGEFALDSSPVDNTDEAGRAEIRITVPQALVAEQVLSGRLGSMQNGGTADSEPAVYAFEIADETNGTLLVLPVTVAASSQQPTPTPSPSPTDDPRPGPGLPGTGANVAWIIGGALLLLIVGSGLLLLRRNRSGASNG